MNTKTVHLTAEIKLKDISILSEGEIFRETILRKAEELEQMASGPRNIDISKLFSDRPLRKKTMDKYARIDETHFVFSIDKIAKF